jgi:hypothetical protein
MVDPVDEWDIMRYSTTRQIKPPSRTALFDAASGWNIAAVKMILTAAPELAETTDARGRRALHVACAVRPGSGMLGEPNGIKTVTAFLNAAASLEVEVPMDEDEGDFRATPLWYAVARSENLPLVRFLLKRGADASYSPECRRHRTGTPPAEGFPRPFDAFEATRIVPQGRIHFLTSRFTDARPTVIEFAATQASIYWRQRGAERSIIAPRRNNSAHLHRPWRATLSCSTM